MQDAVCPTIIFTNSKDQLKARTRTLGYSQVLGLIVVHSKQQVIRTAIESLVQESSEAFLPRGVPQKTRAVRPPIVLCMV